MRLQDISSVRHLVTHDNCPDGLASAMIVKDALPDIETVRFVTHNSEEHKTLPALPHTLFVDFAPTADRVQDFVDAGALILDHHKHAKDIVARFGPNGIFADENEDPGIAGTNLAFLHVWLPLRQQAFSMRKQHVNHEEVTSLTERFARLSGIRDTWQKDNAEWRAACVQTAALMFYPREHWLNSGDPRCYLTRPELDVGEIELKNRHDKVLRAAGEIERWSFSTGDQIVQCASINELAIVSDLAEHLRNVEGISVTVGYKFKSIDGKPTVTFSMRSDGSIDIGAFAKFHGGGGHTRAAGMQLPCDAASILSPQNFIAKTLESFPA